MSEANQARAELVAMARDLIAHGRAGTFPTAPALARRSASTYTDPETFARELNRVFRRVPLILAAGCELKNAGDRKVIEIAGVPVVLVRGRDGVARAMPNVCPHRGSIVAHECGSSARLTCPYHGWVFDDNGALVGVPSRADVGLTDAEEFRLRSFPTAERAGLIWAVLDPASTLDINGFLGVYGHMLDRFGFASWHQFDQRTLVGANWKLAFDAHLDFYHLPVLHRNTFGADVSPRAYYYEWGPHQRLTRPTKRGGPAVPAQVDLFAQQDWPQDQWTDEAMLLGEWIVYPNVSLNSFYTAGLRGVLISQILPGKTVAESVTVQTYVVEHEPNEVQRAAVTEMFDFLGRVVGDEDMPASLSQQRGLSSGLVDEVLYGCNEGGIAQFHRWTDRIVATADGDLDELFREGLAPTSPGR